MTDTELKNQLKEYRRYLGTQGYKSGTPGPLELRMDAATQFARFLARKPLKYGERLPADWRGR